MRDRLHVIARWALAISLFLTSVLSFVEQVLFDEDEFASRIAASLDDETVRTALSTRAVDIALDSTDTDLLLADNLPEDIRLAATPALELSKPVLGRAGAEVLDLDVVKTALDDASRSVHRQTTAAILSDDEQNVTINMRPILVVTGDALLGPVGARAAVDADLPDSVASIDLGSNTGPIWLTVRALGGLSALFGVLVLLSLITFFVTAKRGSRLLAARRLGRTFIKAGLAIIVVGGIAVIIAGTALEIALSTDEALSFGRITIGSPSGGGGFSLAAILLAPISASGRRVLVNGVVLIAASYLLGGGAMAQAVRSSIRSHRLGPLVEATRASIPTSLRMTRWWLTAGFVALLLAWPSPTLRVVLSATGVVLAAHLALTITTDPSDRWSPARRFLGWEQIDAVDGTDRSGSAAGNRRGLWALATVGLLVWPNYSAGWTLVGVLIIAGLFAATYRWETGPIRAAEKLAEQSAELEADPEWSLRRKIVIGAIGTAMVAALFVPGGDASVSPALADALSDPEPEECNGHAELCDRRLDQVAFAGTHNSMSSSDLGWDLANHQRAIPSQLDNGIRALLIDVQKWDVDVNLAELDLDPEARDLAAAALLGADPPEDGLWMCHKLCQLGATPFSDFLGDTRAFLETNPDEVLIVVIQDDVPAADIKRAIEAAGLEQFALDHEPGTPWPTLAEMIRAGDRVLFMAENNGEPTGWYQSVYEGNVTETGFRFDIVEDFDCEPGRGADDSPLFLINHWVETGLPVPSEADRVNSAEVLRQRVAECEQDRGRRPGIIAVNFAERGDLLLVIDELNGVG